MIAERPYPSRHAKSVEWPEDAAVSRERWESLADRMLDAMANGLTLNLLARDTGINTSWFEIFVTRPEIVRSNRARMYSNEPTEFEQHVDAIDAYLARFDEERQKSGMPTRVETTVTRAVCEAIAEARDLSKIILVDAPPGIGKTEGYRDYIAKARAAEGFACPVWQIEMDEYGMAHMSILERIARQTISRNYGDRDMSALRNAIRDATEGQRGVLIVDEAQHMADADRKQGISILNGLRCFPDGKYFGIVLIGNGEIYRRLKGADQYAQLFSRMDRIEIGGLAEHDEPLGGRPALQKRDVRAVADAWGVADAEGYALSLALARQPGALRNLVKVFGKAKRYYGEISYDTMIAVGAQP